MFDSRTRQEEMRVYSRDHNTTTMANDFNISESTFDTTDEPSQSYPSFTLSTEFCISVHGAIMASLFIIGITR